MKDSWTIHTNDSEATVFVYRKENEITGHIYLYFQRVNYLFFGRVLTTLVGTVLEGMKTALSMNRRW